MGGFATPLVTTSAIFAGSKCSCMNLKVVMLRPMDGLHSRFPSAHLKLYVDDLKVALLGRGAELLEQALRVVAGAIEAIEEGTAAIEAVEDGVNESDTSLEPPKSWPIAILGSQKLGPNRHHYFVDQIIDHSKLSHVKVMIKPDGGISRIRLLGII